MFIKRRIFIEFFDRQTVRITNNLRQRTINIQEVFAKDQVIDLITLRPIKNINGLGWMAENAYLGDELLGLDIYAHTVDGDENEHIGQAYLGSFHYFFPNTHNNFTVGGSSGIFEAVVQENQGITRY